MKKIVKRIFLGIGLFGLIYSCAGRIPNSENFDNQGFNILDSKDDKTPPPFKMMEKRMGWILKDLNLTEQQKEKLDTIKKDIRNDMESHKPEMDKIKQTFKDAFLSEKINKDDLKSKLDILKDKKDEHAANMAKNILNVYNLLTVEQRSKLQEKMSDMDKKMESRMNNPIFKFFAPSPEKMFNHLVSDLDLSSEQKDSLKAIFDKGFSEKKDMFKHFQEIKNQVLAELKTEKATEDSIKKILLQTKAKMESKEDERLNIIIKVHDILNSSQREKLVKKIESHHKGRRHKHC